jgi:hypothetical protein
MYVLSGRKQWGGTFCKTLENLGRNFSTKNRGQWWTFVEFDVMREQGEQMSL